MRTIWLGIGSVAVALAAGLASCGSDDDGGAASTSPTDSGVVTVVSVTSTDFQTLPPPSTTSPPTTSLPPQPGDTIPAESTYTIQSGDFPSTVASKFKVDLQALLDLNGLELNDQNMVPDWPQPGQVIKIPAGATVPNEDGTPGTDVATADTGDTGDTGGATTEAPVTTIDVCAESEYKIQEGDTPSGVAAKFDTTVDALAAANADTQYYEQFIAGITIKIPPKTDC